MNSLRRMILAAVLAALAGSLLPSHGAPAGGGRFTLSYRLGFNLSAEFGDSPLSYPGPDVGGAINRTYDDGFNLIDSSGNAGGRTWNWGYDSDVQAPGDGFVHLSSLAFVDPTAPASVEDGPQHGLEIGYHHRLGGTGSIRWGLEVFAGYTRVGINNNRAQTVATQTTRDAFALGDTIPPLAPYAGTFTGPGPLLSDVPVRSVAAGTAMATSRRELDVDLFGLRIGPAVEIPVTSMISLNLGGGLAVAYADGQFSFDERVEVAGQPDWVRSGSNSSSDALVGVYVSGGVAWQIDPQWQLFGSAQYVHMEDFHIDAGGRSGTLELGSGVFVSLGLGFSF